VYCPFTVNTGDPAAGSQRFSSSRIFSADNSKTRFSWPCNATGVNVSLIFMRSLSR